MIDTAHRIEGLVLGRDGLPYGGRFAHGTCWVGFWPLGMTWSRASGKGLLEAAPLQEDGRFVKDLRPGFAAFQVMALNGREFSPEPVVAVSGSEVVLRMAEGRTLTGRVLDRDGDPLRTVVHGFLQNDEDRDFEARSRRGIYLLYGQQAAASTDAQGRYSLVLPRSAAPVSLWVDQGPTGFKDIPAGATALPDILVGRGTGLRPLA